MNHKKIIAGTLFGGILEYYDFMVFGLMIVYIKNVFLPEMSSEVGYLLGFLLFSIGYIGRPIGSVILGIIGETKGRKSSILISICVLTISTVGVGCIPSYESIGIISPIILIILRLLQNMAVSIEQVGCSLYLIETYDLYKYRVTSLVFGSFYLGAFCGGIVVLYLSYFYNHQTIVAWAWRIPFLISLPFGILTAWMRLSMPDSPYYIVKANTAQKRPWSSFIYKINYTRLIKIVLSFAVLPALSYTSVIYIPNLLIKTIPNGENLILILSLFSNLFIFSLVLINGYMYDKLICNPKKTINTAILMFLIISYPLQIMLNCGEFIWIILGQLFLLIIVSIIAAGILLQVFNSKDSDNYYYTNLGFNIAIAIFGGLTPSIVGLLDYNYGYKSASLYYIAICFISYIAINRKLLFKQEKFVIYN